MIRSNESSPTLAAGSISSDDSDSSRVGDKFVAFVKDGWNSVKRFTGDHDIEAHCVLNDEPQQIGRKEHRASFFTIVYFPPEDETEADTIKLRIEFCGSAIQGERFTSADLDVMLTYKDSHHPFALHRKPADSITVLNVYPSNSKDEPTAVHCRHGRQTSVALGLSHDPVNGNVEWKRQSCMEFAHITSSSVEGFGVGTPRVAWSFREDPTAGHGLDAHYDLSITLRKNVRQHMIQMSYFAKAKTSGGYTLELGTKEDPRYRLLPPFGAKVIGNPTEIALATIGKGLLKMTGSHRE